MTVLSKSQLLESIQSGYRLFKELLAELDAEAMTQPGVIESWSVKDILAHITVHEQRMIQWITERLQDGNPILPQPYSMPDEELDRLNAQIYLENRDSTLEAVRRDFDRAHAEALTLVETSAAEDLFDPQRFQLLGGEPLWEAIAANTFWHYEEHARDIRAWQMAVSGIQSR